MTATLTDVQQDIKAHLNEEIAAGNRYFKSKYIAQELDWSTKSIGINLGLLQDKTDSLHIEMWSGGSSGTTWLVTESDTPQNEASENDALTVASATTDD